MKICQVRKFNTLKYEDSLSLQEALVSNRIKGKISDQLLILSHFPVITISRGADSYKDLITSPSVLNKLGISICHTPRGGKVTAHFPGQLIGYPILMLMDKERDLNGYLRKIEEVIIRTLLDFGVNAERRKGFTGVWVGNNKIAAIGIHCWKWVTSHGFAINVDNDMQIFKHIIPCGIKDAGITSISGELGNDLEKDIDRLFLEERISYHFGQVFERDMIFDNKVFDSKMIFNEDEYAFQIRTAAAETSMA